MVTVLTKNTKKTNSVNDISTPCLSTSVIETYAVDSDSSLFGPLCENMTSATKPEVHNISHCRQRRTEPRPQVTYTENSVKFGCVVFETFEQTDRQTNKETDRHADHNTSRLYREQSKCLSGYERPGIIMTYGLIRFPAVNLISRLLVNPSPPVTNQILTSPTHHVPISHPGSLRGRIWYLWTLKVNGKKTGGRLRWSTFP